MIKITAIILADKKEKIIVNCLKSLSWAPEIILIDVNCGAEVLRMAEKYQCRIIKADAEFNFGKWRNQGAIAAKGEWLLYVDTDERVSLELKEEILNKINNDGGENGGFFIPRRNFFWGKEFKSVYPDYQLRLIKKKAFIGWKGKIHETAKIKGEIGKLIQPLLHLSHRSLDSAWHNTLNWSKLEAENRLESGHPKMTGPRFLRIIFSGLWEQFFVRRIWREGAEGVIEGIYQAFSLFATYVRLWEFQQKQGLEKSYQEIDRKIIRKDKK